MARKLTQKEFEDKVKNCKNGEEYQVLGTYINSNTKIKFKHLVCGKEFETDSVHFISMGRRCPHCFKNRKKTTEQFKKEIDEKYQGEYKVIGEYKNCNTKIEILHTKCNKIFKSTPTNLLHGYGCSHCNRNFAKTTDEFKKEIEELTDNEYELISEYKNNKTKVKIFHNKCKKSFDMRPNDFITGHRCPHCALLPHDSQGVLLIENYLKSKNINYIKEFSFSDCKYKRVLPFDFKIDINNEIYLVEFDGEQHFKPMKQLGGEEAFKQCQIRDKIKNEYCKNNNIKFLRISYTQINNINELLNNFLE